MKYLCFLYFLFYLGTAQANNCDFQIEPKNLEDYNFVIVPGILNEFIAFYMTEYRRYFLNQGIHEDQIIRINTNTFNAPKKEAKKIAQRLKQVKYKDKKFIFFTHSKGALELFYLLEDYDLDKVSHAFLIQGPFDGASSYDVLYKETKDIKHFLFSVFRKFKNLSFFSNRYERYSTQKVRENVAEILKRPGIYDKLTFVSSETTFDKLPFKMRITGMIYDQFYGEVGDGVLLKTNQVPHEIDQSKACILDLEASHDVFVKAAPWQTQRIQRIHRFIESLLFNQVFQMPLK